MSWRVECQTGRNLAGDCPDGNVVEALSSGLPSALAAVREAGLPDLDFYDQGITFTVAIRRTEAVGRPTAATASAESAESAKSVDKSPELLDMLSEPKTVTDLAEALGITVKAVRKRLHRLRSAGLVAQVGGPGQRATYERRM